MKNVISKFELPKRNRILIHTLVAVSFMTSSLAGPRRAEAAGGPPPSAFVRPALPSPTVQRARLAAQGFQLWTWQESRCADCELGFVMNDARIRTAKVKAFAEALASHKAGLIKLYGVDGDEYNLLAHMSIGILGRESLFFESRRYQIKETAPQIIRMMKMLSIYLAGSDETPSPNSRGPTQIKIVPELIAENYDVTVDTLYKPENAALATMGFLIEALGELKRRIKLNDLDFINESNYVDYLPYIYFGSTRSLVKKTATPAKNIYVKEMKQYMSWVELYERPAQGDLAVEESLSSTEGSTTTIFKTQQTAQ